MAAISLKDIASFLITRGWGYYHLKIFRQFVYGNDMRWQWRCMICLLNHSCADCKQYQPFTCTLSLFTGSKGTLRIDRPVINKQCLSKYEMMTCDRVDTFIARFLIGYFCKLTFKIHNLQTELLNCYEAGLDSQKRISGIILSLHWKSIYGLMAYIPIIYIRAKWRARLITYVWLLEMMNQRYSSPIRA